MLEQLRSFYELVLFTAGSRDYLDCVSNFLRDENGVSYFDHLLCKDYMRVLPNKTYEKDLSVLLEGRSINDILIIDNNETKIKTHAQNVIPIMDYTGSQHDVEL